MRLVIIGLLFEAVRILNKLVLKATVVEYRVFVHSSVSGRKPRTHVLEICV